MIVDLYQRCGVHVGIAEKLPLGQLNFSKSTFWTGQLQFSIQDRFKIDTGGVYGCILFIWRYNDSACTDGRKTRLGFLINNSFKVNIWGVYNDEVTLFPRLLGMQRSVCGWRKHRIQIKFSFPIRSQHLGSIWIYFVYLKA